MKYELLSETNGIKIFARIDDDGLCRFTCTEDNADYQAYLNKDKPQVEHLTDVVE